ncbi:MAG: DUF5004 domain-containing protein [Bacteroidetes bacterium]|nr:MAG: DUF5004 domain-containing protein [Bacteroidota bacterium]
MINLHRSTLYCHMKKYSLLLLLPLLIFASSCSNKNKLIGAWKLEEMNIEKALINVPDNQKAMAMGLMEKLLERLKGKMIIHFNEDQSFVVETPGKDGESKQDKGTWKISKDQKEITTVVDGKQDKLHVRSLSQNRLVIGMDLTGTGEVDISFTR